MINNLGNKATMAKNIKKYMAISGVTSKQMCEVLDVPPSTFSYWINARTYPRIDKIEKMAEFFGIAKSQLVEEEYKNLIGYNSHEVSEELISLIKSGFFTRQQQDEILFALIEEMKR